MVALHQASQVSYPFGHGPAEFNQVRSIQEVSDSARAFPPPFLHLCAAIHEIRGEMKSTRAELMGKLAAVERRQAEQCQCTVM